MLPCLADYERLIYSLQDRFASIRRSTLVVIRHGPAFAEVSGVIEFDGGVTLTVWEDLNLARNVIQGYSYAVNRGGERLYWYDPQPHPGDPGLASTNPHHKHIPPNIRRNRVPATGLSFDDPNLPHLIEEVQGILLASPPPPSETECPRAP